MIRATQSIGPATILQNLYTFIVPSSGSITVTTGALLLTTALDRTYPACYMYFPAGAWTASAAGFYYVVMSSTTAGLVYSNVYVSGVPAAPASPTLVTTGAGAYVQTTGAYLAGQSFTIPAGTMGLNSRLYFEAPCIRNNTANQNILKFILGGSDVFGGSGFTSVIGMDQPVTVINRNSLSSQTFRYISGSNSLNVGSMAVNTGTDLTLVVNYRMAVATDWIASQWVNVQVTR